MEIASTEQPTNYPILHEQSFAADAERGSISTKLALTLGTLVTAAVVGGSLGAGEFSLQHPLIKTEVAVSAGKGMLTSVRPLAEACYGVYQNDVTDASAVFEKKVTLPLLGTIGTTYKASSTFNGNITSKVCNDNTEVSLHYDKATGRFQLTVPGSAFHTEVSRTNPTVNAFTHDNGALMMIQRNFENEINVLPKLHANKSDNLLGTLDGYAELAADQTSAEACGPKAWPYLEPLYKEGLKQQLVDEAARWDPNLKLTKEKIDVDVTGEFHPTTQYEKLLADIKPQAEKHGVSFALPDPNKLVCTVSPDLQKDLQSAGATK
ncbi:MAG: hypothetical protein ABI602_01345 [Candidatus Saccharibacteria bacterium]